MSDALRLLAVLGLVGANAFFVIGEYAVVTARRAALAPRGEARNRGAAAALRLMDDPVRVISTVQVGITVIGILTGALGEPLVRDLLGGGLPGWLSFVIAFAVVTYLSVVLGELVPKALTLERAEALAMIVAPPVELLSIVLRPVVWVLQGSASLLLRPFGIREVIAGETIRSAEELRGLVDEAHDAGVIPHGQDELLQRVFDFGARQVGDVMVAAADVAWLDAGLSPDEALDRAGDAPHERYVVGRGSIDRLAGIVHVHDLLAAARRGDAATIGDLARPAPIVPVTKALSELLDELRAERQQLAVVVDEYGMTAGIVSLEDVLEQLVGDIRDEYDASEPDLVRLADGTIRAAGSLTLTEVDRALGTSLPRRGPRTLAGLALDALGRRPAPGDTVELPGVRLRVDRVEGLRIARLTITLTEEAPGNEN